MGYFYVDDSVHDSAGFILLAFVYSDKDLNSEIIEIISANGLDPEQFEFKSGAFRSQQEDPKKLREDLKESLYRNCRLGVAVVPRSARSQLGGECLKAVAHFMTNDTQGVITKPVFIFVDSGLFSSVSAAEAAATTVGISDAVFFFEQNSKDVKGIQLADLAAHTASIHLKAIMGLVKKMVRTGENSGGDPDDLVELGVEMWASLRYLYFRQSRKEWTGDRIADSTVDVYPQGLYISGLCDEKLTQNSRDAFATVFLGCIH